MKATLLKKPSTETTSFTQMLAKAEAEIARLTAQERQVTLHLHADQAELQALNSQAEAHATEKRVAQATIDQRRASLKEAETRATIAEGTLSEKPDLKPLARLLEKAQTDQLVILDRIGKAEQAEERRHIALVEAINHHHQTLADLFERKEAMETAKARVWSEYGQAELHAQCQKLSTLQDALRRAEQSVQQAKEEIDTFVREATANLQDWPELQVQFAGIPLYHDHLTHILDSAIALIEIVQAEGRGAEIPWEVTQRLHMPFTGLAELLSLDAFHLRSAFHKGAADVAILEERKTQIQRVLQVYREARR